MFAGFGLPQHPLLANVGATCLHVSVDAATYLLARRALYGCLCYSYFLQAASAQLDASSTAVVDSGHIEMTVD